MWDQGGIHDRYIFQVSKYKVYNRASRHVVSQRNSLTQCGVITNKGNIWTCDNMTYMMYWTTEASLQDLGRSYIQHINICIMCSLGSLWFI